MLYSSLNVGLRFLYKFVSWELEESCGRVWYGVNAVRVLVLL